jgi:hypothetical protein
LDEKDDLLAGRLSRSRRDESVITLSYIVNHFLTARESLVEYGELARRTFLC